MADKRFRQVLSALQQEEALLQAQLGKIRSAISALGGAALERQARRAKTVVRRTGKMTAAQRKAVSERMKKYWAERRRAK